MPNYGDTKYWDERYTQQKNATFDWLEGWSDLKDIIEKFAVQGLYNTDKNSSFQNNNSEAALKDQNDNISQPVSEEKQAKIRENLKVLNLGCGNSIICEDMYDDGYRTIYNMDISAICIDQMRERNEKTRPSMMWDVMDVRDLKYPDCKFDLIIDKSTIDALLCGDNAYLNVCKMMRECQRVLKEGGYYIAISYGQPENRMFHFKREFLHCNVQTFQIQKQQSNDKDAPPSFHYIYILQKLTGADEISENNFNKIFTAIKKEIDDENSDNNIDQSQDNTFTKSNVAQQESTEGNNEQSSSQNYRDQKKNNQVSAEQEEAKSQGNSYPNDRSDLINDSSLKQNQEKI